MLVEAAAYDHAVRVAAAVAEETKVAAANLSGRHIGPVVNRLQWEKIQVRGGVGASVCVGVGVRVRVRVGIALVLTQLHSRS